METNNKKTTRILAVLCIAVAVICIIGFYVQKSIQSSSGRNSSAGH